MKELSKNEKLAMLLIGGSCVDVEIEDIENDLENLEFEIECWPDEDGKSPTGPFPDREDDFGLPNENTMYQ